MKKLFTAAMVVLAITSMTGGAASAKNKKCEPSTKTATTATIPDVTLPFTFVCQHCAMKITIKTKEDWSKSCGPCACGVSNLECYKQPKK